MHKISAQSAEVTSHVRWEPALALLAAGGISYALPESLSVGPRWLLLVIVLVLLGPTILAIEKGTIR